MITQDPLYKTAAAIRKLSNRTKKLVPVGGATREFPITSIVADYTITDEDYTIIADASSGAIVVSLIPAEDVYREGAGRVFVIKRINSGVNAVNVTADGAQTVDGSVTYTLAAQYDFIMIQSDGANWHIIGIG